MASFMVYLSYKQSTSLSYTLGICECFINVILSPYNNLWIFYQHEWDQSQEDKLGI